jgi:hypothetical protein
VSRKRYFRAEPAIQRRLGKILPGLQEKQRQEGIVYTVKEESKRVPMPPGGRPRNQILNNGAILP